MLDAGEVVETLKQLANLGWITGEGTWRIEQQGVCWSGVGPTELGRQVIDPKPRYRGRRLHSSEQLSYVDHIDNGLLTFYVDLHAGPNRCARHCSLTLLVDGVPLDTTPYEVLRANLPTLNAPTFRIRNEDLLDGEVLNRRVANRVMEPRAFLVRTRPLTSRRAMDLDGPWVEGVILADPLARAPRSTRQRVGLPVGSRGDVLGLIRQHHRVGDAVEYRSERVRSVRAGDVQVVTLISDWRNTEPNIRDTSPARPDVT